MAVDPDSKAWVEMWRVTGPLLEEIRRKDLAGINLAEHIEALSDVYDAALRDLPQRTGSGMVEQAS